MHTSDRYQIIRLGNAFIVSTYGLFVTEISSFGNCASYEKNNFLSRFLSSECFTISASSVCSSAVVDPRVGRTMDVLSPTFTEYIILKTSKEP